MSAPLLELKQISKRFEKKLDAVGKFARSMGANLKEETVHAVDRVDLTIGKGEVVGLVGGIRLRQIDAGPRGGRPACAERWP